MRLFLKKIKSGFLVPTAVFVLLCGVFSVSAGAVKNFGKPIVYSFCSETDSTFSNPSGTAISSGALSWKLYDSRESRQNPDGLSVGEGYVLLKDANPLKNMSDFRLEVIYFSSVDGESEAGKPFFLTSTKKYTMIQYITDSTSGFGISESGDVYLAGKKINHAGGEKPEDILSPRNPEIAPGDECRLTVKYVGGKLTVTLTYNSGKTTVTLAENYECVISGLQQMVLGGDKGNRLGGFTYKSLSVSEYADYVPDADSGVRAIVVCGENIKEYDNADTALNDAVKEAGGGNSPVLKLYSDITLKNAIKVPDGKSLTVDLNGHTVNRNRHSTMSSDGCVFLVGAGASLTVEDSSPDARNYSTAISGGVITGGAGDDVGGGIQLAGNSTLTMTGGSIVGCVTNDHGGAIRVDGDNVKINISSAGFYSNMTLDSADNSHGGAFYSDGSGCEVTVADSVFEGNYSEDSGGAVYINDGKFTAVNCLFSGNKCLDHGGAVYVERGSSVSFDNCSFVNNRSDGYAGAVYCNSSDGTRLSGKFRNNSAGKAGGALFVNGDAVSVQDAEITGNITGDRGGGMYVDELYDINIQGLLVVKDNYKENKSRDDIFLDSIGIATARVYDGGLYDGSEIWVLTSGNQTVSEYISDFQKRYFHSDDPSKTLSFTADGSKTRGQTLITSAIGGGNVLFIIIAAAVIAIAAVTAVIVKSKKKGAGKMKSKYKLLSVITACILLAAFTVNQLQDVISFAVESRRYLEAVEIFTAPTKAEAKEKCINAGYLASDADLNQFNSGGAVVLGYKITDDPDEAITDMSVLEMNSGYEVSDYADIKEAAMEKAGFVTSELKKTVSEYSENLQAGSPKAIKARQILNIYIIPEMNNIGLGDYLASNKFTEDFLKKIICQANAGVIYAIFNSLSSGAADYGEDNWAQRVEKSEVRAQLAGGNENALLDGKYKDFAYELCDQLQFFAENYAKAKQYTDDNGMKALEEDVEKTKEGEISDETLEKLENGEKFEEKDGYFIYLAAYELMSKFKYDENTTVAQYILDLGNSTYKTDADLRKIYPLVDALTPGQVGVFRVSGITQMALALSDDSVVLDKTNEAIADIYDKIKDAYDGKTEHLSIWINTDQTQYNTKIAKTSANIISTNSGMEFNSLTRENRFEKKADEIIALTYVIGSAIDIAGILTTVGAEIAAIQKVGFSAWLSGGSAAAWTVCTNAIAFTSGSIFTSILGILGCTAIILGYVAFAAIICVTLYQIGKFFYDLIKDEDDTMDYSLDDIPRDVYDYRNQAYLHYRVVQLNGTEKGADLNAENGRRFAALYYTKDGNAGEPLEINPDGEEFKVISGDISAPDGFESVRYFSRGAIANLNSYAVNKDAKSLFLSYYKSPAVPINEGEESEGPETASGKTEYLESLSVSVQKTEAAAKDELKKAGYTLIDINLSGFYGKNGGMYTYLGYKTTAIAKEAVTDIRIVPQGISTGSAFYFGNNAYTRAGGDDIPANIPSIYFSKSPNAGSPVYPDLQVTNSRKKAKEGFEPVNLFCGGDAYNLNATGDSDDDPMSLKYSHWSDSTNVYIYFHPSVTFTEGQKYIGGMAFFTGKNTTANSGDEIMQYAQANGFTVCSENFTDDYEIIFNVKHHLGKGSVTREEKVSDIVTYLGYSLTYNPYRAIYGIKSYTAISSAMESLNEMMIVNANESSKESYAACNVFYQFGNEIEHGDEELKFFSRGILNSNAWNGINEQSRQTILPEVEEYPGQEKDDFEDYAWETSAPRLKNLYVCGYVPGKTPLKDTDIAVSDSPEEEEAGGGAGLYSVQDMKTPNRAEAHNIGISSKNPVYLFFRQNKPSQGRYISSISLGSWNFDTYLGSDKSFQSMSSDEKEEIKEKYGAIKDDLCISNVLQSSGDEIINRNLAVKFADSKQASPENEPAQAAYIGVTRTDNSADAIHSIIKFRFKNKSEAELKIKVGGTEFTRVGKEPVYDGHSGAYFLYVSKSGSAPGEPITSISFSDIPIVENCATVLTAVGSDVTEYSKGKEVTKSRAELKGYANESNFIHCEYETQRTYICDIFIASGATETAAMLELLDMGCNMFLPIDMNKDANGNYIFIGYDRAESKSYAVRDIICTAGKKAEPEIEINGAVYQRARDRFIMNYDDSGAVSFNEGTNGYSIYLYYTYETKNEPIMKLAASERDYVPDNRGAYIWEPVLTDTLNFCNFNDGVYASENGHSVDNRIYLYVNRIDNSMKAGLKLPKGSTEDTMAYGELKTVSA